jgi:methionyl-tRNA synthetase
MRIPKNYYVTTPIYYVNGRPHIGHAYTTIAADTLAAYHRLLGSNVRFLTGTDEHGQKVYEAAKARNMEPKAHCDDMVVGWKAMMEKLGVRYDRFIRTTDEDHQSLVQNVLNTLHAKGEIYKDSYTGWYSTSVERFWTEKDLVDGKCPESGQPVQEITETNYFFRMSNYQAQLLQLIEDRPDMIRPASRRNEVLGFLRKPLGDLCISRPKSRMSWGIELPFDEDYVTYVWFDALLNYLTGTGYKVGEDTDYGAWWPADVQLIGKDILTTHAVYWTTMLMALGVEAPKILFAHGWWVTVDGTKMSKSLGNAIDVDLLCEAFGVDATRYFFLREIAFGADGGFSYDLFLSRYNNDLANDLGNLAHRGLSMTTKWLGGVVPEDCEPGPAEAELRTLATQTVAAFHEGIESVRFQHGLEGVMKLVSAGNKYIDSQEPWALNRDGNTERLRTVKRHVLEICYLAATLLRPIMPTKSQELVEKLGATEEDSVRYLTTLLEQAEAGEVTLDGLTVGAAVTLGDPLFPRFREMPEVIAALAEPEPEPEPEREPEPTIEFDDFMKVKLRAGQVLEAEPHPKADRLLVLKVDVGEASPRTIVAGIRSAFTPEDVVGRKVVVVTNLKPAKLRGVLSEGMLLAAGEKEVVDLVSVDAEPGEVIR